MKKLTIILIIVAIVLMTIGGIIDVMGNNFLKYKNYNISKEHMWFDGIFTLLLAIIVENYEKCLVLFVEQ